MEKAYAVYAGPDGQIGIDGRMLALGASGDQWVELTPESLVPLPPEADLFLLPRRRPAGVNRQSGRPELLPGEERVAVAAGLPPGYTRLFLPAYRSLPAAPRLPLFGYTAVAAVNGRLFVAARKTDAATAGWRVRKGEETRLPALVEKKLAAHPENRILKQLAHCTLVYKCLTARNIFLGRGEGGIPVSPACNARCLGCISLQPAECCPSPQERIAFQPSVEEVVEVALPHLQAGKNIISFGQGCEGEPLTAWPLLVRAVERIRRHTGAGTVNINTNGGIPEGLEALAGAGLNSARISLLSANPANYDRYHRPRDYRLDQVAESIDRLGAKGVFISLNLLVMPGFTDRYEEMEALFSWLHRHPVNMVQLRNLNIDPEWFWRAMGAGAGPAIGISRFCTELKKEFPSLLVGNFNRPL
jgi:pyruvate-formate lyase-activating enzyme